MKSAVTAKYARACAKYFTLIEKRTGGGELYYEVLFSNGVVAGEIMRSDGGEFVFWIDCPKGLWSEHNLIGIGTTLAELNAPYYKELEEFFNDNKVV